MKRVWQWCQRNRHEPVREQYRTLCQKLRGYNQYYGIRGNYRRMARLYQAVERAWRYWLSRRSNESHLTVEKFSKLTTKLPLPRPRILHRI